MLNAFQAFLQDKKAIKPQYVPFYLKWVSDGYGFLIEPLSRRLTGDRKKEFLSHMAKRHEEWEVRQADMASRFMARMIFGHGLRLHECLRLRIKDVDMEPRRQESARRTASRHSLRRSLARIASTGSPG